MSLDSIPTLTLTKPTAKLPKLMERNDCANLKRCCCNLISAVIARRYFVVCQ